MEINRITLRNEFFDNLYSDPELEERRTKWTQENIRNFPSKKCKDFESKDGLHFRLLGNIVEKSVAADSCYESALFIRIGFEWTLVAGTHIINSSNEWINEIARETIDFVTTNKIQLGIFSVTNLYDETPPLQMVG